MTAGATAGSIVCGVDDSPEAARAVRLAEGLADSLGLRLVLVHAARAAPLPRVAPFGAGYPPDAVQSLAALSLEAGEELLDRVQGGATGPERRVAIGRPAEVLCDVAVREDAALLVIGSRGRGSLAGAVLGSVSTDVIASAPCPVVVVPAGRSGGDG